MENWYYGLSLSGQKGQDRVPQGRHIIARKFISGLTYKGNRKMIFVWINKQNWKTPGPIVNMAVHNAHSFSEIGFETHLCMGSGENSDTLTDLRDFYGLSPNPAFHIHRIPRWQLGKSAYSISVFYEAARLVLSLSKKDRVAVITRNSGFLWFLIWLCRHPNICGYYELHDFYADLSWVKEKTSGHFREKFYEHLFLPRIDGLICITESQQKLYRRVFPDIPSCAFPLGTKIRNEKSNPEEMRKRRTLMYVGHLHGEKGLDFLLQVSAKLSAHGIRTVFWGGKEREVAELQQKIRKMGMEHALEFVSFQPPEQMHKAMSEKAGAGVVMLKDTYYNRYLTCPVKALDYLSHGLPTIGSDLASVREVMADACLYVPPDDEERFAAAALELFDTPQLYEKIVLLAQKRAEQISWQNRAKAISDFILAEQKGFSLDSFCMQTTENRKYK